MPLAALEAVIEIAVLALPNKHPDDLTEYRDAYHRIQTLIAWRVARRADPDTWGTET